MVSESSSSIWIRGEVLTYLSTLLDLLSELNGAFSMWDNNSLTSSSDSCAQKDLGIVDLINILPQRYLCPEGSI